MICNLTTLNKVSNRKRAITFISSPRLSFSWGRGFRIRGVCPWQARGREQTNFFFNSKLGNFQQLLEPCGNNSSIPCRVFAFFKIYFMCICLAAPDLSCITKGHQSSLWQARSYTSSMWTLSCRMWDLAPWRRIQPGPPALRGWSLSHWITRSPREVLSSALYALTQDEVAG